MLVVLASGELSGGTFSAGTATFGSQPLTRIALADTNRDSAIWVLDLGNEISETATLEITASTQHGGQNFALGAVQLSGIDFSSVPIGGEGTYGAETSGFTYTALSAGSIVLGTSGVNVNSSNVSLAGDFASGSTSATLSMNSAGGINVYKNGVSGDFDAFFTSSEADSAFATVAVSAIPEPGSVALLGLATGGWFLFGSWRRRSRI